MIRVDITSLVFFYILFSVIAIFIVWVVLGYRRTRSVSGYGDKGGSIWKCSICLNDYVDSLHDDMSICPLCGSYNKREE